MWTQDKRITFNLHTSIEFTFILIPLSLSATMSISLPLCRQTKKKIQQTHGYSNTPKLYQSDTATHFSACSNAYFDFDLIFVYQK